MTAAHQPALLTRLLKNVSRSFHLTLRILPKAVRPQISLAYLLARTTDTIADTELVPVENRLHALDRLRARILGRSKVPLTFGNLLEHQASPAERTLLERAEDSLALLSSLSEDDQRHIRAVLDVITGGQQLDLQRFASADADHIVGLHSDAELDDYTWRVAGCVGEFWTNICRARLFPNASLDDAFLLQNGVRFGKGLQLVNILRDLPRDLRQGRCYLPQDRLCQLNLTPSDLLVPGNEIRFRPLYHEYLARAHDHLAAGWSYTNALPRGQWRIRLACAWPVLIGARTLEELRRRNVLDPARRVKISRAQVRMLMLRSVLLLPFRALWRRQLPLPSTRE